MLIACPACASEYEIEGVLVGAEGRSVRCAACSETWFVSPERGPSASEAGEAVNADVWEPDAREVAARDDAPERPETMPPPIIDQPVPPRRARPRPPSKKAVVPRPSPALAAGLAAFALLPLILLGRATVVRAMPRSAGLFAAVGLPVNLRGVAFRDVVAFRSPADAGTPMQLVVEGDLVGIARERVAVSALEIELRDADERPLHRWTVPPARTALEPGETARFRASLPSPPLPGSRVLVRFTDTEPPDAASAGPVAGHAEADAHGRTATAQGHH